MRPYLEPLAGMVRAAKVIQAFDLTRKTAVVVEQKGMSPTGAWRETFVGVPHFTSAVVASALTLTATYAAASDKRVTRHSHSALPTADAVELGRLAPLARRSTTLQDYGDAPFARSLAEQRLVRSSRENDHHEGRAASACDPRVAGSLGHDCGPATRDFAPTYFTPSFVSSPQERGQDPAVQSAITPPVTSLFYAFDAVVSGQAFVAHPR